MPTIADALSALNLYSAWLKTAENQGCAGVDGETLAMFSERLQVNLDTLADEVRYGLYHPKPLLRVAMPKPDGSKRSLSIPCVRDRVLQTAVCLVLTPLFEAEFEDASFAYRSGRSVEQAVARIEALRDQGYQWVVDADIRTFFDQVDHAVLMQQIQGLVVDADIRRLIGAWLTADVFDNGQYFTLAKGLPQGSPLSPLLANLYLDRLDEVLLEHDYRLIRYADDFVVLCCNEQQAQQALQLTEEVLAELRLCFHGKKTGITNFNRGFRFLGVEFIRSLVFKSQYPPDSVPLLVDPQTVDSDPESLAITPNVDILSSMQQAFLEAGIKPGQFINTQPAQEPFESQPTDVFDAVATSESEASRYDPKLKTLYLLKHGAVLGKHSERFVIHYQDEEQHAVPAIHVDQIMVFGNVQISTQAMQYSLQKRIPIFLLSGQGRYFGVIDSFDTEPVLLHRQQFLRAADNPFCLELSAAILHGKLHNSRVLLQRFARHREAPILKTAAGQLAGAIDSIGKVEQLEQLRGYEGSAARQYFQAFARVLDADWQFNGRNKNPPVDPVNAMLSFGYTLLYYNVYSLLRARGLNPHVGYLHPLRPGHPALASDMMEEFRAIIVDAVVFNIALNHKLEPTDFIMPQQPGDACLLNPEARKLFVGLLEAKFNTRVKHPANGLEMDYRRCIQHQIDHLAAVVRGNTAAYRPVLFR
ncbi:MAG: CRISPR-associated endonuclease Cas1 [Methylobacter sp.]|nr:MAG: CRISPR-associated endonuclease Cas1 [Methylobacter sp.]